jgi:hypothetical protein
MKLFALILAASSALACYSGPCVQLTGSFTSYSNGTKDNVNFKVISNGTTVCDSARGWYENRGQFLPECDENIKYSTDGFTSWYVLDSKDDYIFNNKPPVTYGYPCAAKTLCSIVSWDVKMNC